MKAFVTGGTGFIGSRLIKKLLEREYLVYALVRSQADADQLKEAGATPVFGDIDDPDSMIHAMQDCDLVFHLAGWYKLGSLDWRQAEAINVQGTRNVLELAYQLQIPKIIYTSTIAIFSDTKGKIVDESDVAHKGPFLTVYDRTKWEAHYQVALPLIEKGAPIIIVMPGVVYGPGDHSLIGEMMRYYDLGLFAVLPGPELTLTFAHVDDVAEGHILAAERGKIGESYFLTGPILTLPEAARLWSQICGKREPFFHIPGRYLKPFAPIMEALGSFLPIPKILSHDAIAILEATYVANSEKARSELGWRPRGPQEGMIETFQWINEQKMKRPSTLNILQEQLSEIDPARRRVYAGIALGALASLAIAWLLKRRRT